MKLSPLDIRRQEFKRVVRGVDPEEVSVFLDMVAGEYERILRENQSIAEERDDLKRKVDEFDGMREAIQGAVVMAKKSGDEALNQARKEADLRLKEAEVESERLLEDARRRVTLLNREMDDIRNQRAILIGRLKSLLDGQTQMLEAYVADWGQDEDRAGRSDRARSHNLEEREEPVEFRRESHARDRDRRDDDSAEFHHPSRSLDRDEPRTADSDEFYRMSRPRQDDVPQTDGRMEQTESREPSANSNPGEEAETAPPFDRAERDETARLDESLRSPDRPQPSGESRWARFLKPGSLRPRERGEDPRYVRPPRPVVDSKGGGDEGR